MKFLFVLIFVVDLIIAEQNGIRMPAEWEPHERTFLSWPQSEEIWEYNSTNLLPEVREDVAKIANAIVDFEPVVMLCDPTQIESAQRLLDRRVTIVAMKVDDLWARDTLPVFVENNNSSLTGVIFNFNGWGNRQTHQNDALVAEKVVQKYHLENLRAKIVAEGGAFETDGQGTLLVTESSLVNTNRNNQSKEEIEEELKRVLGVRKIIWFKGVRDQDITDAHVDCLVRFVEPGKVILNRPFPGEKPDVWSASSDEALSVLQSSTDAHGRSFEIVELFEPDPYEIIVKGDENDFLSSYVNFLIGNGFVIVPEFGDRKADLEAQGTLQKLFPRREIVPVQIRALASGGGGIHCATHDQPVIKR